MIRARLAAGLALVHSLALASGMVRVAVVAGQGDWRSPGLARSVANCLNRCGRIVVVNRRMAERLVPQGPLERAVAAGRRLRADLVVRVGSDGQSGAWAKVLDLASAKLAQVSGGAAPDKLPGVLARAIVARAGLELSPGESAAVERPLVASAQAMEALWRGDGAGTPREKVEHYRRAVELDPASAVARNRLGAALARCGKLDQALAQFDEAARLDPTYPSPHTNRALVLVRRERWKEAEAEFRKAIALNAKTATPYLGLARLLDRLGATIEAVEQLEKATELDPCRLDALLTLANYYFESYDLRAARKTLDRVLELDPENVEALNLRGLTLLVPRQWEEAEADFRKALALKPDDPESLANLGLALYGQGKVEEAIESEERALAADPSLAKAHLYLGRIYVAEKRYDEAAEEFQKACELQPDLAAARRGLSEARAAAARGSSGCGCLSRGGGKPRLASVAFPALALLLPHVVRLTRRRRQRM